jgi:hypothetical protein
MEKQSMQTATQSLWISVLIILFTITSTQAQTLEWSSLSNSAPSDTATFIYRESAGTYGVEDAAGMASYIAGEIVYDGTSIELDPNGTMTAPDATSICMDVEGGTCGSASNDDGTISIGGNNTCTANNSFCGGYDIVANGTATGCFILGQQVAAANCWKSVSIGEETDVADAQYNGAFGHRSAGTADYAFGFGSGANAAHEGSMVFCTASSPSTCNSPEADTFSVHDMALVLEGYSTASRPSISNADNAIIFNTDKDQYEFYNGTGWKEIATEDDIPASPPWCFAVSDFNTTDLAASTGVFSIYLPQTVTLTDITASVRTAPTGSTITFDCNDDGSTFLSTKLTIDAGETSSHTAATDAVISSATIAANSLLTCDIDQVGSSTAGKGGTICLVGSWQ